MTAQRVRHPTHTTHTTHTTHLGQLNRVGAQPLCKVRGDAGVSGVVGEADAEGLVLEQRDGLLAGEGAVGVNFGKQSNSKSVRGC